MTTCKGTYRDEHVPADVGVIAAVYEPYCMHAATERCTIGEQPHSFAQCGEFDQPRPGFEPPSDLPARAGRPQWVHDWDEIHRRLDAGESMFAILRQRLSKAA